MTIRRNSRRCCPKRSRSPTCPTRTRSPKRCVSSPTGATAPTGGRCWPARPARCPSSSQPSCGGRSARRSGRAPHDNSDFTRARTAAPTTSTSDCNHGTSRSCSGPRTTTGRSPSCSTSTTSRTGSDAASARCCSRGCSRHSTGTPRCATSTSPRRFINKGYNTTFAKLRIARPLRRARRRVKRIANQHAQHELIDYKQRRALLGDWDGIDIDCWHLLQPRPRPLVAVPPHGQAPSAPRAPRCGCGAISPAATSAPRQSRCPPRAGSPTKRSSPRRPADPARAAADPRRASIATPADARSTLLNRLAAALHQRGYLAENYHLGHDRPADHRPRARARRRPHRRRHPDPSPPPRSDRTRRPPSPTPGCSPPDCCAAPPSPPTPRSPRHRRRRQPPRRQRPRATAKRSTATRTWPPNSTSSPARSSDWQTPPPNHPTAPHHERMHDIATAIKPTPPSSRPLPRARRRPAHQHRPLPPAHRPHLPRASPTSTTIKDAQPTYSQTSSPATAATTPASTALPATPEQRTRTPAASGLRRRQPQARPHKPQPHPIAATGNYPSHWKLA